MFGTLVSLLNGGESRVGSQFSEWGTNITASEAIFVKVGRLASEEVVLQLLNSKCIPVLLYGLEACPLLKSDLSSVDFVIVRFLI